MTLYILAEAEKHLLDDLSRFDKYVTCNLFDLLSDKIKDLSTSSTTDYYLEEAKGPFHTKIQKTTQKKAKKGTKFEQKSAFAESRLYQLALVLPVWRRAGSWIHNLRS